MKNLKNWKSFNESANNDIIDNIKKLLISEYTGDDIKNMEEEWKDFVDHQEMGNCQGIVATIITNFPEVTKVFGEIEVDEPFTDPWDEDSEPNYLFTHHWVEIDGTYYDFSKGTLKDYIDWNDVYGVETDEWRYNKL
jgi:hypothetical protein